MPSSSDSNNLFLSFLVSSSSRFVHQIFAYEYLLLTLNGLFALISCLKYSYIHKFAYAHNFSSIRCHTRTHAHTLQEISARNTNLERLLLAWVQVICITEYIGVVFNLRGGQFSLTPLLICGFVLRSKQRPQITLQ